ncbi:HET-domain-containing protein, partial [Glonium stellatum]
MRHYALFDDAVWSPAPHNYSGGNPSFSSKEIRLVILQPSCQWSSLIQCNIYTTSLEGNPPPTYDVLSYAWHGTSRTKQLQLNGEIVQPTESLESALRHLRRHEESRVLWIDEMCVNQADAAERNYAVRSMRSIFQQAQNVIAWLGDESDGSEEVFEHVAELSRFVQSERDTDKPFDSLLRRDYWTRIWILQEIVLAKDAML